jgi:hypothetical protein
MKTTIKNFTGVQAVEIKAHRTDRSATVMISQGAGSMNFQIDLTAADARLMAAALIASAQEIERGRANYVSDSRSLILGQAVANHNGVWPENLTSGVMFFNGERITKEEFFDFAPL